MAKFMIKLTNIHLLIISINVKYTKYTHSVYLNYIWLHQDKIVICEVQEFDLVVIAGESVYTDLSEKSLNDSTWL